MYVINSIGQYLEYIDGLKASGRRPTLDTSKVRITGSPVVTNGEVQTSPWFMVELLNWNVVNVHPAFDRYQRDTEKKEEWEKLKERIILKNEKGERICALTKLTKSECQQIHKGVGDDGQQNFIDGPFYSYNMNGAIQLHHESCDGKYYDEKYLKGYWRAPHMILGHRFDLAITFGLLNKDKTFKEVYTKEDHKLLAQLSMFIPPNGFKSWCLPQYSENLNRLEKWYAKAASLSMDLSRIDRPQLV